jgi:acyl-coenzyme A thioesterase PaaI-like protein
VFFKMLDDAAFFAVASVVTDVFVLTASFHVSLLRPIATGEMRSVGRVVRASSTLSVAEAVLYDPDGKEAARGIGDFARSKVALSAELGYA